MPSSLFVVTDMYSLKNIVLRNVDYRES